MTLLVVIGVIIILIFLLLFLPFYINLKICKQEKDDNIEIRFMFIKGLINIKVKLPFIETVNMEDGLAFKILEKFESGKKEKNVSSKKDIITLENIIEKIEKIKEYHEKFSDAIYYINDSISITKMFWETRLGLGDAALTAVVSGGIWSIKGLFFSFFLKDKEIKNPKINVIPEFNKKTFDIDFDCIIKMRLVYIIIAGIKVLKAILKGGVKDV